MVEAHDLALRFVWPRFTQRVVQKKQSSFMWFWMIRAIDRSPEVSSSTCCMLRDNAQHTPCVHVRV